MILHFDLRISIDDLVSLSCAELFNLKPNFNILITGDFHKKGISSFSQFLYQRELGRERHRPVPHARVLVRRKGPEGKRG